MAAPTNTRGIVRLGLFWLALVAAFALVVSAAVAADASRSQPLPPSFCSKVVSGGDPAPDYIIASDLGLQNGGEPAVMVAAIKFVLAQHGFKAAATRSDINRATTRRPRILKATWRSAPRTQRRMPPTRASSA
jgi:hypothetical protein